MCVHTKITDETFIPTCWQFEMQRMKITSGKTEGFYRDNSLYDIHFTYVS